MVQCTARRDLKKEAYWRQAVPRQSVSGLSIRAWCRDQGVQEATFHWWRRELARRDAEQTEVGTVGVADPIVRTGSGRSARPPRPSVTVVDCVAETKPASFVPVRVPGNDPDGERSLIEIVLTDGRRVRVTGSVHPQTLGDVLDVLECRAC